MQPNKAHYGLIRTDNGIHFDKGCRTFDVRHPHFAGGAKGDGIANDQAAFDAAYAAAVDAVGLGYTGIILVPAGTYIATLSVYVSGIYVIGDGSFVTEIKQPAATYRAVTDAAITTGTAVLGSAAGAFTSADVGKTVFVAGAADSSEDLIAVITSVRSSAVVTLDRNAGTTVSGAVARIGCGRNVVEFNKTYLGNHAPAMERCGIMGVTLNGNKANVSAVANAGDDLVLHGVIFTNCPYWKMRDVVAKNCHNTGADICINSNWGDAQDVYVESCGNSTTGMPGFDVNSSSYCTFNVKSYLSWVGFRLLDNCFGNIGNIIVRKSGSQAAIFDNQSVNLSTGNNFRVTATECGTGSVAGYVYIGQNCFDNDYWIDAHYAGGTFAVSAGVDVVTSTLAHCGVQIGTETLTDVLKPHGNRIKINARKNGGAAVVIRGNYNDIDVIAVENSQQSALAVYAIEVNGSYNNVRVLCKDGAGKQRGIAVRAQSGEVGTAATGNNIQIVQANPTSPYDDSGTGNVALPTGARVVIDGWYQENLGAGQAATAMSRLATTTDNPTAWIANRAGSITAVTLHSNAARSADGCTLYVYKNGVLLAGPTASIDGTNTTFKSSTFAKGTYTFVAGDKLQLYLDSGASWAPTTADMRGSLEVET